MLNFLNLMVFYKQEANMLKIITLLMFSALLLYPQSIAAREINTTGTTDYDYTSFDENSFNISDEQFKEVEEAYSILSDESKRKMYDQYGHAGVGNGDGPGGFGGG